MPSNCILTDYIPVSIEEFF